MAKRKKELVMSKRMLEVGFIHEMPIAPHWISVTVTAPEGASIDELDAILSIAIGRIEYARKGLKHGKA